MNTKYNIGDKVKTNDFSGVCTITAIGKVNKDGERLYVVRNNFGSELVERESDIFIEVVK